MTSTNSTNTQMPPQVPPPVPPQAPPAAEAPVLGGLIPYKNPAALTAYYLGIFAFIPVLGILLGIPAFILGIIGLRRAGRNPQIKGKVHAWIGVIVGGLFGFGQLLVFIYVFFIPMLLNQPPRY